MTVLTIRACKRYATRQKVRVRTAGAPAADGLLIELSAEGYRISNLPTASSFTVGQEVAVEMGQETFAGRIRWSRDNIAGVRLDRALHADQISALLARANIGGSERQVA